MIVLTDDFPEYQSMLQPLFFDRKLYMQIPRPQRIFSLLEEGEKEALEHFKHVIKVCPNRGHIFSE